MPYKPASSGARRHLHEDSSDPDGRQPHVSRPLSSNLHTRLVGAVAPIKKISRQAFQRTNSDGDADETEQHSQLPPSQLALQKYLLSCQVLQKQHHETEALPGPTSSHLITAAQSTIKTRQRMKRGVDITSWESRPLPSPRTPRTTTPHTHTPLSPDRQDTGSSGSEFSDHHLSSHAPALHAHMQQSLLKQQQQRQQQTRLTTIDAHHHSADHRHSTSPHQNRRGHSYSQSSGSSSSSPESVRHWSVFSRPAPQRAAPARASPRPTLHAAPTFSPAHQHHRISPTATATRNDVKVRPAASLTQRLRKMASALGRVDDAMVGLRGDGEDESDEHHPVTWTIPSVAVPPYSPRLSRPSRSTSPAQARIASASQLVHKNAPRPASAHAFLSAAQHSADATARQDDSLGHRRRDVAGQHSVQSGHCGNSRGQGSGSESGGEDGPRWRGSAQRRADAAVRGGGQHARGRSPRQQAVAATIGSQVSRSHMQSLMVQQRLAGHVTDLKVRESCFSKLDGLVRQDSGAGGSQVSQPLLHVVCRDSQGRLRLCPAHRSCISSPTAGPRLCAKVQLKDPVRPNQGPRERSFTSGVEQHS